MQEQKRQRRTSLSVREIAYIALFIALMSICAWIAIPLTVPFTLQTFALFVSVGLLGTKRSCIALCCYLLLGALGLPVFNGFTGGMGVLLGVTGGYLFGFILSALVCGMMIIRLGRRVWAMAASMLCGLLACYAIGTVWFLNVYTNTNGAVSVLTALSWCVFPFILPDCVKIALAILVTKRLERHVNLDEKPLQAAG